MTHQLDLIAQPLPVDAIAIGDKVRQPVDTQRPAPEVEVAPHRQLYDPAEGMPAAPCLGLAATHLSRCIGGEEVIALRIVVGIGRLVAEETIEVGVKALRLDTGCQQL